MVDINKTYYELTNVDIEKQRELWDERGKGYYGEFLVFKELYMNIPGTCKMLMNLQIPTINGKTTEIDFLMIHETGIYVFEIKHYKGTIYGKIEDKIWTQYFRTSRNNTFVNPVEQNRYHIDAISKLYPAVPIYSYVVFTNPVCELKIQNTTSEITVCNLRDLLFFVNYKINSLPVFFDMQLIDCIFDDFKKHSPIVEKPIKIDGEIVPFYMYVDEIRKNYQQKIEDDELKSKINIKRTKKKVFLSAIIYTATMLCGCLIFGLVCHISVLNNQKMALDAQQELQTFARKFQRVDEISVDDIVITSDLITVSNVLLEKSIDLEGVINFSFRLNWNGAQYGVEIPKGAKIIVVLSDGAVQEYDIVINSSVRLNRFNKYTQSNLYELQIMDIEDISYIKVNGLKLYKISRPNVYVKENMEIELYDSNK